MFIFVLNIVNLKATRIYHFNPTCELALANGSPNYYAPALLQQFEEELAPIMQFFAAPDDHVLKAKKVSNAFIDKLYQFGLMNTSILDRSQSLEIVLGKDQPVDLQPWGWSSAELKFLDGYKDFAEPPIQAQTIINMNLMERKHALEILNRIVKEHPNEPFPKPDSLPKILKTLDDVENYLGTYQQIVLKAPLSSSGRGLQAIRRSTLNLSNKQWINTNLKYQGYLIGEPLFDKKQDLSFQFEFLPDGQIEFRGISYFSTNANGQYLGHYLNKQSTNHIKYFTDSDLLNVANLLSSYLNKSIYANNYVGFLGVDALIYQSRNNIKIQPCLEVNARYNMGILSKYIEKKIHPQSSGIFQVYYHPTNGFKDFARQEMRRNPPQISDGFFRKGFIPVTEATPTSKFGAFIKLDDEQWIQPISLNE